MKKPCKKIKQIKEKVDKVIHTKIDIANALSEAKKIKNKYKGM